MQWPVLVATALLLPFGGSVHVIKKGETKYEPTWESLDSRPLPTWYDESKIGIFIHWGVFSVPSFGSEWFWTNWVGENGNGTYSDFMRANYPPRFTYQDFAKDFTTEFYNPQQWAELFAASGAKYVVLTSKHHEGYTLWPSKVAFSWNAKDVGPNRDLLGELAEAIRSTTDLHFGVYHSLYEWYNPLYLADKNNQFQTRDFAEKKTIPELYELIDQYQPDVIWSDGDWEVDENYWQSKEFLTWLYNESPIRDTVVTNDRWGAGTGCAHGGFFNCADRYSPGVLQAHKWENALTLDRNSWGFRRNAKFADYLSIEELLGELVKTVSCGGNVLVNVGPTREGTITPIFEERLLQMGSWLTVNGEAIYSSQPWTYQNDTVTPDVWYTKRDNNVYAMALFWPDNNVLTLTAPQLNENSEMTLLGGPSLSYTTNEDSVEVQFPTTSQVTAEWVYVIRITNVAN